MGDYIWVDANNDGKQDADESALTGAVVTLLGKDGTAAKDADGNEVAAITTGADGKYLFSNLPAGEYSVTIKAPAGYVPTKGGAVVISSMNPIPDSNCSAR